MKATSLKHIAFQQFITNVITDQATQNHTQKFDVSFKQLENMNWIGDGGEFSMGGFQVELVRSRGPFFTHTIGPTFMVTIISFFSFVIPVEMVPGRMALLITIYLMLINIKNNEQNMGPVVSSPFTDHPILISNTLVMSL